MFYVKETDGELQVFNYGCANSFRIFCWRSAVNTRLPTLATITSVWLGGKHTRPSSAAVVTSYELVLCWFVNLRRLVLCNRSKKTTVKILNGGWEFVGESLKMRIRKRDVTSSRAVCANVKV